MKKFRTIGCVIIMCISAIIGLFVGSAFNNEMNGAILFSLISGIACIVYNIDNRDN